MKQIGPKSIALLQQFSAGIPLENLKSQRWQNLLPRLVLLGLVNYSQEIKGWCITEKGRQLLDDKGLL